MYDIVTIGEILVEILAEKVNQEFTCPGTLYGPYPSGAPAIAIDQASRMGAKTAIISKIGNDDFGLLNKERLKQNGVDLSYIIETDNNTTGTAFVTYYSNGDRKFIYHFTHAASGELDHNDINEDLIKKSKIIHIMGCSVSGSPSLCNAIMHSVRLAKQYKVKISFDPNIRPELLKNNIENYKEIIDACDILLTGKSEFINLFPDIKYESSIVNLLKQKHRIIVIKDGSKDTFVYTREECFMLAPFPASIVDSTGAGDSFDGTFLAFLCQGQDLKTAALYANAAGAKAVEKRGPMEGNSNRSELDKLVNDNPDIIAKDIALSP